MFDKHPGQVQQIQHFFEHYKDLEPSKWVKLKASVQDGKTKYHGEPCPVNAKQ